MTKPKPGALLLVHKTVTVRLLTGESFVEVSLKTESDVAGVSQDLTLRFPAVEASRLLELLDRALA